MFQLQQQDICCHLRLDCRPSYGCNKITAHPNRIHRKVYVKTLNRWKTRNGIHYTNSNLRLIFGGTKSTACSRQAHLDIHRGRRCASYRISQLQLLLYADKYNLGSHQAYTATDMTSSHCAITSLLRRAILELKCYHSGIDNSAYRKNYFDFKLKLLLILYLKILNIYYPTGRAIR